ncbi:hypothetical protein LXA43DRAFT_1044446 [Ganoderma leucocontextum]|nr:hypothetical protein LXA43DRAFT_1044446 [Ganoderma leucocontextum]
MNPTSNHPHDIPSHAPSRAGHRRPPLKRTHASHNLFPDLAPIQTICTPSPDIDSTALADEVATNIGGGPCDRRDYHIKVDLSPMCPPSPPSPISSSSDSSTSSLATPLDADDWERFHDGFAPPLLTRPHVHPWPPTPNPNIPPHLPPQGCDSYHGWSGNSLFEMKRFWYRRHRAWWDYDEHCRHLQNYLTSASDSQENLDATMYYPPSPALLPSRLTPWSGPNGISFNTDSTTMDTLSLPRAPRLQVYPPWAPLFPRFGDIEDLREPSCEILDRMFMNFPPYVITKLLYVEQLAAQAQNLGARQDTLGLSAPVPPSPSVPLDTPWSPGSVYSEDERGVVELSTMATSSTMSLAPRASGHYSGLRWLDRWELLKQRLFPQSLSPSSTTSSTSPLLSSAESDLAQSSPLVQLPPRPGTPLPDDEPNRAAFLVHLADAHSDRNAGDSKVHDDALHVCAESGEPRRPPPPPEVRTPAPPPERDGSPSNADAGPVVRLPSSSSHPPRTYAARLTPDTREAHPPRRAPRTLADELSAALDSAGVQFSVAPPSAVVQVSSPRFSFFAEESAFDCEFEEDGGPGFGVGVGTVSVSLGPPVGMGGVHVDAVPC